MIKHLILCCLIAISFISNAQQYNFINYTVEDGLAQNQVFDIAQDNDGYLWIATAGGVSRFDGKEFVNFTKREGLYKNLIKCVFIDNSGLVWFGSVGGVSFYNGEKFTNIELPKGYSANQVSSFTQDVNGNIWFSTIGAGIFKVKGNKTLKHITEKDGLNSNTVRSLHTHEDGTIWIGTKYGINIIKDGVFAQLEFNQEVPKRYSISHITSDGSGAIWVSTYKDGMIKYANQNYQEFNSSKGIIHNAVRATCVINENHFWLATRKGVSEIKGNRVENYTLTSGLSYENVRNIIKDREGNIWLATDGQGLLKFTGKKFVNYTVKDGLLDDQILSIVQDDEKNLWFSSHSKGLVKFSNLNYEFYTIEQGLAYNTVWTSLNDKKGNLWFGTSVGLSRFGDGAFTNFKSSENSNSILNNKCTALYLDHKNEIWVGHQKGISKYVNDTLFQNFGTEEEFYGTTIMSINQDANNVYWIGAENGLFTYDGLSFSKVSIAANESENKISSIKKDKDGELWFGTENGLYYKTENGFNFIELGKDSRSNFINFIESNGEELWVGTNYGVFSLDISENKKSPKIKSFTYHEGIKNLECNLNSGYIDNSGSLWFGTTGGLVHKLHNAKSDYKKENSKTIIRNIKLFLEDVDWTQYGQIDKKTKLPIALELPFNKNRLRFEFININFSNPDNVRYEYKLEGYDENWSPITKERYANYTEIPPGDYKFIVKATDETGSWVSNEAVFKFSIKNPFWKTWTFFMLCTVGFVFLVIGIGYWIRKIQKRNEKTKQLEYKSKLLALEQQSLNASMNRHFIFNALNSIQYYINRQDRISANKYLSAFAKLIRKNLDSSSSDNNYVTLSEEMERTELYLSLEHMRFRDKFDYEIEIDEDIDLEAIKIPAMLLQPFIENSIWHGVLPMQSGGKIKIDLQQKGQYLYFKIQDNGIGVEESLAKKSKHQHESKGMKITTGRLDILKKVTRKDLNLKGPTQLRDSEGNSIGTLVEISLPMNTLE